MGWREQELGSAPWVHLDDGGDDDDCCHDGEPGVAKGIEDDPQGEQVWCLSVPYAAE